MTSPRILRQVALLSLPYCLCCCLTCFHPQVEGAYDVARDTSPGKRKGGSTPRDLLNLIEIPNHHTKDTLPHHSLANGTLLRLHNDCNATTSLAFARASRWQNLLGCGVQLERIEPHNNWKRSQLRLLSTTDFPEVRGAAIWGHEVGGRIAGILVVFWSATCLTKEETCRCNKEGGCPINCQHRGKPSCLASIYGDKLFPLGMRLCQGRRSLESNSEGKGCYFYSLEPEDGWGCGRDSREHTRKQSTMSVLTPVLRKAANSSDSARHIWDRHGTRLGSTPRVRYGTLFVAEFDGHGQRQWVKPLANDVALFFGNAPAVVVQGGEIPGPGGIVDRHYAVTVTRERWVVKDGKTMVFPHCEIVFMTAKGDRKEVDLPGKKCESCQYSLASLHPVTHRWASLCVNAAIPYLGIRINGLLAVDSTQRYKADRADIKTLNPVLSYLKDTCGRLMPAVEGYWVLIWKEASWQVSLTEGLTALTATVKAAVWQQKQGFLGTLGRPTLLLGPSMELRLRSVDAVALSQQIAMVTAMDQISGKALVAAVDLSEVSEKRSVSIIDIAAHNGPVFDLLRRRVSVLVRSDVALLLEAPTRSSLSSGASRQLPDSPLLDTPQQMLIAKNRAREDCRGQSASTIMPLVLIPLCITVSLPRWKASSSTCSSLCLQQQSFQSTTKNNACPWGPTDFRLVHCDEGDCPDWRKGASLFVGNASAEASPFLDKNLQTYLKLNSASNTLTLRLAQPVDVEEVVVYIKPVDVSLKLDIFDAENKYVYSSVFSFTALDAFADGQAGQAWVTTNVLLRRVSGFEITANPPTDAEIESDAEWSVDLLELGLRSTPSPPCAGGGFSPEESGCKATEGQPESLEELDCKGEWGEWSVCDQNCTRKRLFKILSPARRGGKPCVSYAVEQCAGTGLCLLSDRSHGQTHDVLHLQQNHQEQTAARAFRNTDLSQDCVSSLFPKSQCFSCRTLQIYQVTQQALGRGKSCPTEPFVLEYCDSQCASVYGSTTTAAPLTNSPLESFFTVAAPGLNMQEVQDILFLLKTVALYLGVGLLACIVTAYLVGLFPRRAAFASEVRRGIAILFGPSASRHPFKKATPRQGQGFLARDVAAGVRHSSAALGRNTAGKTKTHAARPPGDFLVSLQKRHEG